MSDPRPAPTWGVEPPLPGKAARDVTRRAFLGTVAGAAALTVACGRRPYDSSQFELPAESRVALLSAPDYSANLADLILRGIRETGLQVAGRRVLLKPNLVEHEKHAAINTHPAVVAGAAEALLEAGAREVVVAEGPGHRRDVEYILEATGLLDVLADMRLRFVDLNHDDVRRVPLRSRFMQLDEISLPVELLGADLVVSMPKLKVHHWAGLTCSMKNLFGTVPGGVYGWPKNLLHWRGIDNAILDLAATVRPALAIVDAVVSMEGDGPIMGQPRATGFLAIGRDPVAVDAVCARAIGLDPGKLRYLADAGRFLGNVRTARIRHVGERPERFSFRFDVPPHLAGLRA